MEWRWGRRAFGAARRLCRPAVLSAAACAVTLAACQVQAPPNLAVTQPRGASVAFDSIDGLPRAQFQTLVQDLNDEAQTHRLAVISRENPSAYRVRGYLAAEVAKKQTTVSWVWDVFDSAQHRALRISGEVPASGSQHEEGWPAVDNATLRKVAQTCMDKLAAFLTSPGIAPRIAPSRLALAAVPASSPEAAGIFRIFHAHADPVPEAEALPAAESQSAAMATPVSLTVPLPRRRPSPATAVSARETTTLAARAAR